MKPHRDLPPRPTPPGTTEPTSSSPVVLGIDPGGHCTGLVLRVGGLAHWAELVTNDTRGITDDYLAEIIDAATLAVSGALGSVDFVAVEDVVAPGGFAHGAVAFVNVKGLLDTAQVIGALRWWGRCSTNRLVFVAPCGHGSAPLATYPAQLVGPNEPKGTGKLRHARSAWDIAGAAVEQARIGSALGLG